VLRYENALRKRGYDSIIGVDEAGRGPLAGPVVAAAVLLRNFCFDNRIDDSKKLSQAQRERAFFEIRSKSLYALAEAGNKVIDRVNILQATILAMRRAIGKLAAQLDAHELKRVFVLVDGNMRFDAGFPCRSLVGGDGKSLSIAASSILAKVHRDGLMQRYDGMYPLYRFNRHKGYPTPEHRRILKELGPLPIHRKTFLRCLEERI
jgi:ribonuclease HII